MIVPDVGGAFGSKGVIAPEVAAVAAASIVVGRPLKWTEDRYENFLAAYQGRGIDGELELALDADGRMLALRGLLWADLGAYLLTTTPRPPLTAAMLLTGCYDIPAASVTLFGAQHEQGPDRALPRRGAARRDVHDRAARRRCRASAGDRSRGAAPVQRDPALSASHAARLHLRLR